MYTVGSDALTLAPTSAGTAPSGPLHAVDEDGTVLCRDAKARFHFPASPWMTEDTAEADRERACPACATVALEREMPVQTAEAYPVPMAVGQTSVPAPLTAFAWLQGDPAVDPAEHLTGWSAGL
jgi:hypothetical protein